MHLINDALQALTAPMTAEQLGKIHAPALKEGLNEVTQSKNPKSKILGSGDSALKIEQLKTDLAQSREALLKPQDEEFDALVKDLLEQKNISQPRKIEVVRSEPLQQDGDKVKEHKLASPKIKSLRQLDPHDVMDDADEVLNPNEAMNRIDEVKKKAEVLKAQVILLCKQLDQIGIEGGAKNKKIADQAKLLQEKGRALRAQLESFKKYPNKNVLNSVSNVTYQLNRAIREVSQIVEETQRNRNLVDGLGLQTNPWHGKPLSKEEGEEIIENQDPGWTWRDVTDKKAQQKIGKNLIPVSKDSYLKKTVDGQASDDESEAATDAETISTDLTDDINIKESTPSL